MGGWTGEVFFLGEGVVVQKKERIYWWTDPESSPGFAFAIEGRVTQPWANAPRPPADEGDSWRFGCTAGGWNDGLAVWLTFEFFLLRGQICDIISIDFANRRVKNEAKAYQDQKCFSHGASHFCGGGH